jgi:hypothetical protein
MLRAKNNRFRRCFSEALSIMPYFDQPNWLSNASGFLIGKCLGLKDFQYLFALIIFVIAVTCLLKSIVKTIKTPAISFP